MRNAAGTLLTTRRGRAGKGIDLKNNGRYGAVELVTWREALIGKLALAIRAATGVALLTSILVLAGALAANRRVRLADATILKILGATRTRLTAMFLIEYAILGTATAAFALGAGTLTAYLVVKRIMLSDFAFDWTAALAAAVGGLAFTIGLGMIGAWRVLGQKPAAFLREL